MHECTKHEFIDSPHMFCYIYIYIIYDIIVILPGSARLSKPLGYLSEDTPPGGLCVYRSAPPLPIHHHHNAHTPPQVAYKSTCLCTNTLALTSHLIIGLFISAYILCPQSSIYISRKSWHTLLNTCFHMAMTTAIYSGGISLTSYPVVCQAVSPSI